MGPQSLFASEPIGRFFDRKVRALAAEVDAMTDDALLAADEEQLARDLADKYVAECRLLREDEKEVDGWVY